MTLTVVKEQFHDAESSGQLCLHVTLPLKTIWYSWMVSLLTSPNLVFFLFPRHSPLLISSPLLTLTT